MQCQQYINQFNAHAKKVKFLTYPDELVLSNKLKQIQDNFTNEISSCEFSSFLTNLYHLLCQSSNMKSELLENCLDILLTCINSENQNIRNSLLTDCRFLAMLIGNLLNFHENEDKKLIKTLTIIQELLAYNSEMNEHNLKLVTEALRDYTAHDNEEVKTLCFQILANLCLDNEAAKYIISRALKTSHLRENVTKLPDNLVSFKFYLMMEDVVMKKDFKYFMQFAFNALIESIEKLKADPPRHALDIVKHYKKKELQYNLDISDDEEIVLSMSKLTQKLIHKMSAPATPGVRKFFDNIFQFFDELISIDMNLVNHLTNFVEAAFTTAALRNSEQALNLLKTFIESNGQLQSSEIVIESLLDSFIGENDGDVEYRRKYVFLQLLEALENKEKLSDVHVITITTYFDQTLESFKAANLSSLTDDDCFTFIYLLSALSSFAKNRAAFYGKLNDVIKIDYLPVLIVRAHLSRNEDILMILFRLTNLPNFPNQKIASMLSKNGKGSNGTMNQSVLNSLERRAIQTNNTKFISIRLSEDLDALIEKINSKVDSNDLGANTSDIVQLYRHKISHLSEQLSTVTSSLEQSTVESGELQQKFSNFVKLSEKQEFVNWCLQLDNDRINKELRVLQADNKRLKVSLSDFQALIDKSDRAKQEAKKALKLKIEEAARLIEDKAQIEEKLRESKARLNVVQQKNETRIAELKESLEKEKKSKEEELVNVLAEKKRLDQKLAKSEKDNQKLQEVIHLNETEIIQMRDKVESYEGELREFEQMKNSVMNLMQTRSFKK